MEYTTDLLEILNNIDPSLLDYQECRRPQKPIHDAFGHRADHGRLRGRAKQYFRTKKKFGMTFPKNRTKKNA